MAQYCNRWSIQHFSTACLGRSNKLACLSVYVFPNISFIGSVRSNLNSHYLLYQSNPWIQLISKLQYETHSLFSYSQTFYLIIIKQIFCKPQLLQVVLPDLPGIIQLFNPPTFFYFCHSILSLMTYAAKVLLVNFLTFKPSVQTGISNVKSLLR